MATGDVTESLKMETLNPATAANAPNANNAQVADADKANAVTVVNVANATTTHSLLAPTNEMPPSSSPSASASAPPSPEPPSPQALSMPLEKKLASAPDGGHLDDTQAAVNSILPALPSTSKNIFSESAAAHGAVDSTNFLQAELAALAAAQQPRVRSASSTLDATISRHPSTTGRHEKKIGHRRVDEGGEVTYKRIQSKQIMGSIQLGIQHTVGSLASKPKRDLLMNDFWELETIAFPSEGSSITPAHHYSDFRFKVYAPIAFRYFRDLFGIAPDDFLMSMCASPLRQLSNPGASGSIFYLTMDDEFIIKTVQKKECEFLQKLLPGYYMNLSQNPRTLLPKFFGLYCFHYNAKNVRLVAMNNLIPSDIKMHAKYDLKGSTFRRKASKTERQKASPTFKDLDFMEHHPNGIFLETDKYNALMKTIQRDCMVLESFQIMDYSLLVGIHNLDLAQKEKREERIRNARAKLQRSEEIREVEDLPPEMDQSQISIYNSATGAAGSTALNRTRSMNRQRLVAHSTAMESITADIDAPLEEDDDVPAGGIPARSSDDERLILYLGIIDILQSYRLEKKLEHTFKSIIYNGDTVSVCRPSFYAQRFQNFMGKTVFKKTPTFPLKHSPSKRKTSTSTQRTPTRTPSQSLSSHTRPILLTGSSTPPPAFDDISEEDITGTSSMGGGGVTVATRSSVSSQRYPQLQQLNHQQQQQQLQQQQRQLHPLHVLRPQTSRISSNRSVISDDYSDDDDDDDDVASSSGGVVALRSPHSPHSPQSPHSPHSASSGRESRSPRLSRTDVQVTAVGYIEDVTQHLHKPLGVGTEVTAPTKIEELDANGKQQPLNSRSATLVKAVQSQTYTTTLVLNDVR